MTYTVCAYLWPPPLQGHNEIEKLADTLTGMIMPESCREVMLELEMRDVAASRYNKAMV
jgi:hypothetical protein